MVSDISDSGVQVCDPNYYNGLCKSVLIIVPMSLQQRRQLPFILVLLAGCKKTLSVSALVLLVYRIQRSEYTVSKL